MVDDRQGALDAGLLDYAKTLRVRVADQKMKILSVKINLKYLNV